MTSARTAIEIAADPLLLRPAGLWLPAFSLCRRELVRFLRQRHRVIGALGTPLVFWLLIGGGMGHSFRFSEAAGGSYIHYFFPGTLLMILLFTAIFSTISVIEDRREGFLQSVLVAPVPREALVLGKIMGGTLLATGQGLLFLLLAPLVGFHLTILSLAILVSLVLLLSFALTALGFCIAWPMSSTQGFHAIMNLFLIPMWFLSGALFPPDSAWWVLRWIMHANPLTYGLSAIRHAMLLHQPAGSTLGGPGLIEGAAVSALFALGLFILASVIARRNTAADLQ